MDDLNLTEALGQVSASEAGVIFRNFLRGGVRQMICEVMAAEVTEFCGPKHPPNNSGTSPPQRCCQTVFAPAQTALRH